MVKHVCLAINTKPIIVSLRTFRYCRRWSITSAWIGVSHEWLC